MTQQDESLDVKADANRIASGLPSPDDQLAAIPVREERSWPPGEMGRRSAMKLMAASTLLAVGAPGCRRKPHRKIVSMVDPPEYQQPGIPVFYASTWNEGTVPYGVRVKSVDGRPIKIEGLPDHPVNRGASSAQMQASILSLYDPERLQGPRKGKQDVSWSQVDHEVIAALKAANRIVLVTRSLLGPSERAIVERLLKACPAASHFVYEPIHDGTRRTAWKSIYGRDGELQPQLDKARIILAIGSDFLGTDGPDLESTRRFATTRCLDGQGKAVEVLSRLYVVESAMTVTGSNADHRLPLRPSAMRGFALALVSAVKGEFGSLDRFAAEHHLDKRLLRAMAGDLASHKGKSVVLAGPHLPTAVHAAVALLNGEIGAMGKTLRWEPRPAALPVSRVAAIEQAIRDEGGADVVCWLGVNPAYDWPGGGLAELLKSVKFTIGYGQYHNETLDACTFALPDTHFLESWNDAIGPSGLSTLCQPVIAPLFKSRQQAESLLVWSKALAPEDKELADCKDWHDFVQGRWRRDLFAADSSWPGMWNAALRTGMVQAGDSKAGESVQLDLDAATRLAAWDDRSTQGDSATGDRLEVLIRPHYALADGRFASNAWLQEMPDPVSKLVWGGGVMVGPETADRLGISTDSLVRVNRSDDGPSVVLPVLVQPGVAAGVLVVTLGHGRTRAGDVGTGVGVNVAPLIGKQGDSSSAFVSVGVSVQVVPKGPPDRSSRLVRTQKTFSMMDRPIVLQGTASEYDENPAFVKTRKHVPPLEQIDAEYDYTQGPKWVMAIDQNACTGCSGCVIACQAENNISVVGKDQCARGREMHWMRIDRYEEGSSGNPTVYQQPMLCQQCDNAPCESVCPVNATSHSMEGLNEQVYNRCVGTRYCANNCPYKVRRFNFLDYRGEAMRDAVRQLVYNPQVTVRSRGVMEKCTFCIQRINAAKFHAKNAGEKIADGMVQPACAESCPAQAIVFGDLNDPDSEVSKMHASSLAYFVLEELNVRPNVAYLARVTNPHPEVTPHSESGHSVSSHSKGGHS